MKYGMFGPVHFAYLAAIPGSAGMLAGLARRRNELSRAFAYLIASVLALNNITDWINRYLQGQAHFPDKLPLQLTDFTLWLTVYTLFSGSKNGFDVIYYLGLAGAGLTCITPELFGPIWEPRAIRFFIAHGGVVTGVLYLLWTRQARPRPGSYGKALLAMAGWAAFTGGFNLIYGTNYMYLVRKPVGTTMMSFFGPWPAYLFVTFAVAAGLFWLLWLPFRDRNAQGEGS
jgi:hypothetical integral membrane protein (TIGR02206 family)